MLRLTCLAVLAFGLLTLARAELPHTDIRDIQQADPGRIASRPSRVVPVAVSLGAANVRIGSFIAIEALSLDMGVLVAAGAGRKEVGTPSEKSFSLVIEGNEYVLDVVEVSFDPVFGMQHVLAAIVNTAPGAYARFTFDPKSGSIAGTVASGGQKCRIISSNDRGGAQLVFGLGSTQAGASGLVTSEKLVASAVAQVERRHAQAERIAAIKPNLFVYPRNGFTTRLQGGAIGNVDVARLGESEVIASLLKELSEFTRAVGNEEFQIESLSTQADGGRRVRFRQLIGGIPVDFTSIMEVGPEGSVKSLLARVFDPSDVPTELISRQEALRIATEEIEREVGHLGIVRIDWMADVRLEYAARSTSQEERAIELTPTWRVPARATTLYGSGSGEAAVVLVNAATGETDVQRNMTLQRAHGHDL